MNRDSQRQIPEESWACGHRTYYLCVDKGEVGIGELHLILEPVLPLSQPPRIEVQHRVGAVEVVVVLLTQLAGLEQRALETIQGASEVFARKVLAEIIVKRFVVAADLNAIP